MRPDLALLDPEDSEVYDMINEGRSQGCLPSPVPAQLKMAQRLRSRCYWTWLTRWLLSDRASASRAAQSPSSWSGTGTERPGEYDHPLEKRALERGCGIIVWQEQVVQLIMDVAGMTAAQAARCGGPSQGPTPTTWSPCTGRGSSRGTGERRAGGDSSQDIREDQRPLYVP